LVWTIPLTNGLRMGMVYYDSTSLIPP
jgi:hypothetical protein